MLAADFVGRTKQAAGVLAVLRSIELRRRRIDISEGVCARCHWLQDVCIVTVSSASGAGSPPCERFLLCIECLMCMQVSVSSASGTGSPPCERFLLCIECLMCMQVSGKHYCSTCAMVLLDVPPPTPVAELRPLTGEYGFLVRMDRLFDEGIATSFAALPARLPRRKVSAPRCQEADGWVPCVVLVWAWYSRVPHRGR